MAIKHKEIYLVCKGKYLRLFGRFQSVTMIIYHEHDHIISHPILSGGSNLRGLAHKSCNLNVKQQYFLSVYIQNSNYNLN